MKKRFLGFSLALLTLGFLGSCSSEEGNGLEEATVEYGFDLDMGDMEVTRAEGSEKVCLTLDELIAYHEAQGTALQAKIQIKYSDLEDIKTFTVPLRVVQSSNPLINDVKKDEPTLGKKRLVTDLVKLDFAENRKFYLKSMYVCAVDAPNIPLYSAVVEGSDAYNEYKNLLDGCYIPANGKELCSVKKWDKVYEDLCLHCAAGHTPGDFGYTILDLQFKKTHKIPFIIDVCSWPGNEDYLGSGIIEVFRSKKTDGTRPTSTGMGEWERVYEGYYGYYGNNGVAKPGYIYFTDDQSIDNDKEWYHIRFTNKKDPLNGFYIESVTECPVPSGETTTNAAYEVNRGISVAQLLNYKNWGGWDETNDYLHFWFCGPVGNTCAIDVNADEDDPNWWDAEAPEEAVTE